MSAFSLARNDRGVRDISTQIIWPNVILSEASVTSAVEGSLSFRFLDSLACGSRLLLIALEARTVSAFSLARNDRMAVAGADSVYSI